MNAPKFDWVYDWPNDLAVAICDQIEAGDDVMWLGDSMLFRDDKQKSKRGGRRDSSLYRRFIQPLPRQGEECPPGPYRPCRAGAGGRGRCAREPEGRDVLRALLPRASSGASRRQRFAGVHPAAGQELAAAASPRRHRHVSGGLRRSLSLRGIPRLMERPRSPQGQAEEGAQGRPHVHGHRDPGPADRRSLAGRSDGQQTDGIRCGGSDAATAKSAKVIGQPRAGKQTDKEMRKILRAILKSRNKAPHNA